MIRLPKNFFTNLTPAQYKEYLKLLPDLKDEKSQLYAMLGFTLVAMSFFGIFAINPTLSTIAELKRQLSDLHFVYEKLVTKTQNLSTLQQKYQYLSGDLPVIIDAMPMKPEVPKFVAQINALIAESNLETRTLQTYGVEITPNKKVPEKQALSYVFSLEAEGTYEEMLIFVQKITRFNRLVTIDMLTIAKDEKRDVLILNLRGREYFKP